LRNALALTHPYPTFLYFDFFHKSCLPCIKAFPDIIELKNSYNPQTLMVYGVDPIQHDTGNWDNFTVHYGINYPIIDDEEALLIKSILFKGRHFGYPISLVISDTGKIIYLQEGYMKNTTKEITELINSKMNKSK
jgi:thiol-disulfide isomerase/thioredoxin